MKFFAVFIFLFLFNHQIKKTQMEFDSNLTDQEQKELFSEVELLFKEKVSNKFAFLG